MIKTLKTEITTMHFNTRCKWKDARIRCHYPGNVSKYRSHVTTRCKWGHILFFSFPNTYSNFISPCVACLVMMVDSVAFWKVCVNCVFQYFIKGLLVSYVSICCLLCASASRCVWYTLNAVEREDDRFDATLLGHTFSSLLSSRHRQD